MRVCRVNKCATATAAEPVTALATSDTLYYQIVPEVEIYISRSFQPSIISDRQVKLETYLVRHTNRFSYLSITIERNATWRVGKEIETGERKAALYSVMHKFINRRAD